MSMQLSFEQRVALDTLLTFWHSWTLSAAADCTSWLAPTPFAPRLHRDGTLDLVTALTPSELAATSLADTPVTFWIGQREADAIVRGHGRLEAVREPWERVEVLAYLRLRSPNAIPPRTETTTPLILRPSWLWYQAHDWARMVGGQQTGCTEAWA